MIKLQVYTYPLNASSQSKTEAKLKGLRSRMANMAGSLRILRGELKYRDGVKKEIILKIDNNLTSMVTGIKKLNEDVSGLLTELVEQEKRCGGGNSRGVETDDGETNFG